MAPLNPSLAARAHALLRSIANVRAIGADDRELVPAVDAWLEGRLPLSGFSRHVDSVDDHGSTLLMVACCFGKVHVTRRLLAAGADATRVNASGRCALCYACLGPHLPIAKSLILEMLLAAGARANLPKAIEIAAIVGRMSYVSACLTRLVTRASTDKAHTHERVVPISHSPLHLPARFSPVACARCV